MTLRVLVACPQMQAGLSRYEAELHRHGIEAVVPPVVQQMSEEDLLEIIDSFDGVIAGDDHFTRPVLERARRLRIISKWGVGTDNIDLVAAAEFGIAVTNTPGAFGAEVADVVVGYMVMLSRRLHEIDREVRGGGWPKFEGTSLASKRLGIIGLGDIGLALARRALALEMAVVGTDPSEAQVRKASDLGVEVVAREELLARADIISLHCPLTAENEHMLNANSFSLMRPGAMLINTARGRLIQEPDLVEALRSGRLAGAALDVFETEPLPADSPLRALPGCILGSHNSSNTKEAASRVNDAALANLVTGLGLDGSG